MKKDNTKDLIISPLKLIKIKYKIPYILNLKNNNRELLCFGSQHSHNPENKQFLKIEKLLYKFIKNKKKENIIILTEGIVPEKTEKKEVMIKKYKEIGILAYLAKENNIKIKSVEPSFKDLIKGVKKEKMKKERIALWIAVNILWGKQKRNLKINDLKDLGKNLLLIYKNLNLNVLKKREDIVNFLINEFKKETGKNIIGVKKSDLNNCQSPFIKKTAINNISSRVNFAKDYLMAKEIIKELKRGKSIFAVFGHNHVAAQEPALKDFFKNKI